MPISVWRSARDAQQGLREDLRLLVMSATIDAARIAGLLGGAPVIESEGRAFPVETRYVGRDHASDRAADGRHHHPRHARGRRLAARLPARCCRNPTHPNPARKPRRGLDRRGRALRCAGRRRTRPRHRTGSARPAQDRAGDFDRGNLDHHRGRAHRRRLRPGAGAALRARRRRDAARNGAGVARGGGSAPRPRRAHRAGRLLPAVGRAADRGARALCPAGNPRRRPFLFRARPRGVGQRRRSSSPSSIRRRGRR